VDIAARRDVVVIFGDLLDSDDATVLLLLAPSSEGVRDAYDGFIGDKVFGVALGELPAGVEEEEFSCATLGLGLV
jgi:hypothetical protein